jgi:hypothetical protein
MDGGSSSAVPVSLKRLGKCPALIAAPVQAGEVDEFSSDLTITLTLSRPIQALRRIPSVDRTRTIWRESVLHRVRVLGLCAMLGLVGAQPVNAHIDGTYIPGLTLSAVIAHFEAFGLNCNNDGTPHGPEPAPNQRGADCSAVVSEKGALVGAIVNYFDDGHVESVWTSISPKDAGVPGTIDAEFAFEWSDHVAELVHIGNDAGAIKAWVRERAPSGECLQGCSRDVDVAVWFLGASRDGLPAQLDLYSTEAVAPPSGAPPLPDTAIPTP